LLVQAHPIFQFVVPAIHNANRSTEIQTKNSGGTVLSDIQYAYDGVNVTSRTDSDGTVMGFGRANSEAGCPQQSARLDPVYGTRRADPSRSAAAPDLARAIVRALDGTEPYHGFLTPAAALRVC
jgi:hypothetical protein